MQLTTKTDKLIDAIITSENEVHLEETNEWVDGMFIRTLGIPEGVILVGHIHKKNTINILTKGKLYMLGTGKIITAPYTYIGEPGEQKAAIALEDSVFMNIIRTDKTNIKETYEDVVVPDERAIIYHMYKQLEEVG